MKRAIKTLLTFLLTIVQLPAVAQSALTLTSGEMSTNTVVAKPTKNIEQVSDGVIVTYTFSTVSETYPTEDFHEMLWNMPGYTETGKVVSYFRTSGVIHQTSNQEKKVVTLQAYNKIPYIDYGKGVSLNFNTNK